MLFSFLLQQVETKMWTNISQRVSKFILNAVGKWAHEFLLYINIHIIYRHIFIYLFIYKAYNSLPFCTLELHTCTAEYLIHQNWPGIDILKSSMSMSVSYSSESTVKLKKTFNRTFLYMQHVSNSCHYSTKTGTNECIQH